MLSKQLRTLLQLSKAQGSDLFVVGGPLRDLLLKKKCTDFDFALRGASELAKQFARDTRSSLVMLDDTPRRETSRVVVRKQVYFDFSEMQGGSIEADLGQRDFTFNAMALPLEKFLKGTKTFLDPHGGREDLKNKVIRALPGPVLSSDPLRMLRAFRFMSTFGFEIDLETLERIKKQKSKIKAVAAERIYSELILLLSSDQAAPSIRAMHNSGLLQYLFPDIHKNGDASDFLRVFDQFEYLTSHPKKTGAVPLREIRNFFSSKRSLVKLAALLYTQEKLSTSSGERRLMKSRHQSKVAKILEKLRASNNDIDLVRTATACACEATDTQLKFAKNPQNSSQLYQFVSHNEDGLVPGLFLALADLPELPTEEAWKTNPTLIAARNTFNFYFKSYLPAKKKKPLLNGDDLIKQLGLKPGSLFKTILEQVEEARILKTIKTRKEALQLASDIYESSRDEEIL
jgi:tRNA nucleotidyltransferase/poly(A) polymerase